MALTHTTDHQGQRETLISPRAQPPKITVLLALRLHRMTIRGVEDPLTITYDVDLHRQMTIPEVNEVAGTTDARHLLDDSAARCVVRETSLQKRSDAQEGGV